MTEPVEITSESTARAVYEQSMADRPEAIPWNELTLAWREAWTAVVTDVLTDPEDSGLLFAIPAVCRLRKSMDKGSEDARDLAARAAADGTAAGSASEAITAALVQDLYADIIAQDLRNHPSAHVLVRRLQNRTADPARVVEKYGFPQGACIAALRARLMCLTGDESRALALIELAGLGIR